MQYKIGTVSVTNASPNVVGVDTEFLANVSPGNYFIRLGDPVTYDVASITDDLNLVLSAPYQGVTGSGVLYTIHTDFSVPDGLPLLSQGDLETAKIYSRAINAIQNLITLGSAPMPMSFVQDAKAGTVFYDGMTLDKGLSLKHVSIYAGIAPVGADMIFKLTNDGVETGENIILNDGAQNQKTTFTAAEIFAAGERLGLKCTQAGSDTPGGEIIITLHPGT